MTAKKKKKLGEYLEPKTPKVSRTIRVPKPIWDECAELARLTQVPKNAWIVAAMKKAAAESRQP